MSKFSETIKKQSRQISLASDEKRLLRERVVSYMAYHPLPEGVRTLDDRTAAPSPQAKFSPEPFSIFRFNSSYVYKFSFLSLLLVVVAVPVFAERSLPGDMLYPMKVQVNEELRSTLALSPYAKIEWESIRLERRLAEARILAQEGKLTEVLEEEVAKAVKKHSDSAQETILSLRETDTEEATIAEVAFVSRLQAQSDIFNLAQTPATEEGEEGELVAVATVDVTPSTLASALKTAYTQAETSQSQMPVSPRQLLALIERETTYAEELFQSIAENVNEKDKQDIERRLQDIQRKVVKSQSLMAGEAEPSAVQLETESVTEDVDEVSDDVARDESVGSEDTLASTSDEVMNDGAVATTSSEAVTVPAKPVDVGEVTVAEVTRLLRGAIVDTRKLISFMTLLDVRQVTSVDRLVPITLTDEEYETSLNLYLKEIEVLETSINSRELDADVQSKVTYNLEQVGEYKEQIVALREAQKLAEAVALAKSAQELLLDLRELVVGAPAVSPDVDNNDVVVATTTASSTDVETGDDDEGETGEEGDIDEEDTDRASSTEEEV